MERYGALLDAIEAQMPARALLQVGAAGGYFLQLARERGWAVRGIEITEVGTRHARDVLGLDVERQQFSGPRARPGPSDVVYLGHVLSTCVRRLPASRRRSTAASRRAAR